MQLWVGVGEVVVGWNCGRVRSWGEWGCGGYSVKGLVCACVCAKTFCKCFVKGIASDPQLSVICAVIGSSSAAWYHASSSFLNPSFFASPACRFATASFSVSCADSVRLALPFSAVIRSVLVLCCASWVSVCENLCECLVKGLASDLQLSVICAVIGSPSAA